MLNNEEKSTSHMIPDSSKAFKTGRCWCCQNSGYFRWAVTEREQEGGSGTLAIFYFFSSNDYMGVSILCKFTKLDTSDLYTFL
jgi:hypothetical protein